MTHPDDGTLSLSFPLDVEDGWPPVAVEEIPFRATSVGFVALAPPLFVRGLSRDDVISARLAGDTHEVSSWSHVTRSRHTTIWLLRQRETDAIARVLHSLRAVGCETVSLAAVGVHSVDVPESVSLQCVDRLLAGLVPDEVAVAFPSMRHEEG